MGFRIHFDDHCIYTRIVDGEIRILSFYVYDILIAGNSVFAINRTKNWLSSKLEMKDMGEASSVFGNSWWLCRTTSQGKGCGKQHQS